VPPIYEVVQRTVRASRTHKGQPECALEVALLINALLLRRYEDVVHPHTKIGVEKSMRENECVSRDVCTMQPAPKALHYVQRLVRPMTTAFVNLKTEMRGAMGDETWFATQQCAAQPVLSQRALH